MPESEITKLRRKRSRIHLVMAQIEKRLEAYRDKLSAVDLAILLLEPDLPLPLRRRDPNPIFRRGELPRIAMAILREEGAPLPIGVIAVRALATKGITLPDPRARLLVRHALRGMFAKWDRRGLTVRVGRGSGCRRGIAGESSQS